MGSLKWGKHFQKKIFSGLWVGLDLSFLPPSFPLKSRRALRPFEIRKKCRHGGP